MRTALLAALILFFAAGSGLCRSVGWKELHEEADEIGLADIFMRVQADPTSTDDLYVLGLVYLNLHRDTQAESIFSDLLHSEPGSLRAKWGIAEVLRRQHELEKSRRLLEEVLKADPEFCPADISLAYIRYLEGDFKGSAALAGDVLKRGRQKADRVNYARAYLILGGAKGMIAHYGGPLAKIINGTAVLSNLKKAQQLKPDYPAVYFGLGAFYLLAPSVAGGNIDTALEYLQKAVKADPLFADAYVRLAQAYRVKGDQEKYRLYLRRALEIDPRNELALDERDGRCKFICPR